MTLYIGDNEITLSSETTKGKVKELAETTSEYRKETDRSTAEIVRILTHREYLKERTIESTLGELTELQLVYSEEFNKYDGEANEFILSRIDGPGCQYWYDYPERILALGLEWAVLSELGEEIIEEHREEDLNYDDIESWDTEELLEEYESIVAFRAVESEEGQISSGEIERLNRVRGEVQRRLG